MRFLRECIIVFILVGFYFTALTLGYNPPYFGYDPKTVQRFLIITVLVCLIAEIIGVFVYRIVKKPSNTLPTPTGEQSTQEHKE